jgi:hypothetical protein
VKAVTPKPGDQPCEAPASEVPTTRMAGGRETRVIHRSETPLFLPAGVSNCSVLRPWMSRARTTEMATANQSIQRPAGQGAFCLSARPRPDEASQPVRRTGRLAFFSAVTAESMASLRNCRNGATPPSRHASRCSPLRRGKLALMRIAMGVQGRVEVRRVWEKILQEKQKSSKP